MSNSEERLKSGTTTVGVIGRECVVLAADQKSTVGNIAADLDVTKIYKINNKVALTIAGGVGDNLTLVRFLRSHAKLFEIERDIPMTPKAVITLLSNILNSNRYYPFMVGNILGGFNSFPELYASDAVGGFNAVEKFTSVGSGFELAFGFLENQYREGMAEEEAIGLAAEAVSVAKKRDIFSGGKSISVFVVNKSGVRELGKEDIERRLKKK